MIDRRSAVCTCTRLRTRECEHNTSSPICPVAAQTRTRSATGLQTVRTTTTAAVHYRWSRPVKAGHGCTAGGGRRAAGGGRRAAGGGRRAARDVTTVTIVVTSTSVGRTTAEAATAEAEYHRSFRIRHSLQKYSNSRCIQLYL